MTLLEFARGPGLHWSLTILVAGACWRLIGLALLRKKSSLAEDRGRWAFGGALRTIITRSFPRAEFRRRTLGAILLSYAFHAGLALVVLGGTPHIQFIKSLTGLSWPGLPAPAILVSGIVAIAALVGLMVRRMTHPVLRRISTFDDYFSWLVTVVPFVTGVMAFTHFGARYENLIAIHILSVEVLFIWFPFGKLMHVALLPFSRGVTGAAFARKGVQV